MRARTSKFLSNLRMLNAEVWKQLTKILAKCSNILTECLSKSYKLHSKSLLAREVFKGRFQDDRGRPCYLGDRQDLNLSVPGSTCCSEALRVLDVRRKAKRFISASNLNELKEKGKTRYT